MIAVVNLLPRRKDLIIYVIYLKIFNKPLVYRVTLGQLRLNEDLSAGKHMHMHLRTDRIFFELSHTNKHTEVTENSPRLCLPKVPNWSVLRQCLASLFCRNDLKY